MNKLWFRELSKKRILLTILVVEILVVTIFLNAPFTFSPSPPTATNIYRQGTNWRSNPWWKQVGTNTTYQVSADSDDVWTEDSSHHTNDNLDRVGKSVGGTLYKSYFRWPINLSKGIVVREAYLKIYASASDPFTTVIRLIDKDNCPDLESSNPFSYGVVGGISWSLPDTLLSWITSPNIASLVQTFIDRGGYSNGNYLGLRLDEGNAGLGEDMHPTDYQGSPSDASILEVHWSYKGATFALKRSLQLSNISYPDRNLRMFKDSVGYWINVTSGANMTANMYDWFDAYGTEIEITSSGTYTFDLYVASKGEPTEVSGADSWSYNSTTQIVTLTATASSSQTVSVNWDLGGSVRLVHPTFSGHRDYGGGNNINGFGCVTGDETYTFEVKVYNPYDPESLKFVELWLAYGKSHVMKLQWQKGNMWREVSDPKNYATLRSTSCTQSRSGRYWTFNFVVSFNANYKPKNVLETARVRVYTDSTGWISDDYIETYYVTGTIKGLTLNGPYPLDDGRIIAEYRNYTFQAEFYSDVAYNETNYVEMTFADETEHEIVLMWTRRVDISITSPSYQQVSGDLNFTEKEDLRNIYSPTLSLCTVEAKLENGDVYTRINFTGVFMLHYPTRNRQDLTVKVVSIENEATESTWNNRFWVETEMWTEYALYGLAPTSLEDIDAVAGFRGGNDFLPWAGDDTFNCSDGGGSWAIAYIHIPNFQYFHWTFNQTTDIGQVSGSLPNASVASVQRITVWLNFSYESGGMYYDEHHGVFIRPYMYWYSTGVNWDLYRKYVEEWKWRTWQGDRWYLHPEEFRQQLTNMAGLSVRQTVNFAHWDAPSNDLQIDSTWDSGFGYASQPQSHSSGFRVQIWVAKNNSAVGYRVTNLQITQNTANDVQEYWEQYYPLKQSYLVMPKWMTLIIRIQQLGISTFDTNENPFIEVTTSRISQIQNDAHEGVDTPPLLLPTEPETWGMWEFLRPILGWLGDALYWIFKPLFDAIVNAVSGVALWILEKLTYIWSSFVWAMDSVFSWISGGTYPHLFTDFVNFLVTAIGSIATWLTYVGTAILNFGNMLVVLLTQVFNWFGDILDFFIWLAGLFYTLIDGTIILLYEWIGATGRFEGSFPGWYVMMVVYIGGFAMMWLDDGVAGAMRYFDWSIKILKFLFIDLLYNFILLVIKVISYIKSHVPFIS